MVAVCSDIRRTASGTYRKERADRRTKDSNRLVEGGEDSDRKDTGVDARQEEAGLEKGVRSEKDAVGVRNALVKKERGTGCSAARQKIWRAGDSVTVAESGWIGWSCCMRRRNHSGGGASHLHD